MSLTFLAFLALAAGSDMVKSLPFSFCGLGAFCADLDRALRMNCVLGKLSGVRISGCLGSEPFFFFFFSDLMTSWEPLVMTSSVLATVTPSAVSDFFFFFLSDFLVTSSASSDASWTGSSEEDFLFFFFDFLVTSSDPLDTATAAGGAN